jgi:hypothetical protein
LTSCKQHPHHLATTALYSAKMLPLPSQSDSPEPFRPSQQARSYRDLKLQDPPRTVTLSPVARPFLALPLLLLWFFYLNLVAVLRHPRETDPLQLLLLFSIPLVLAIVARFLVNSLGHRTLLRTGSWSIGTVLAKQKSSMWSFGKSAVAFDFSVGGHKPMTGRGFDWSGKLAPGKPILVFYDPSDISRYVALCSSFWQVRTHSGEIFRA